MRSIFSLVIAVFWVSILSATPKSPSKKMVEVVIALRQDLSIKLDLPGTFLANNSADLSFPMAGKLKSVLVQEGNSVKEGALIATQDAPELATELEIAKDKVFLARKDMARMHQLYEAKDISAKQYESAKKSFLGISLEATRAKKAFASTLVHAPFDGKLGRLLHKPGAVLKAGVTFATFHDPSSFKIELSMSPQVAESLQVGQEVKVKGKTAHITFIDPAVDAKTGMRFVRLAIKDSRLAPLGSKIMVNLETQKRQQVLTLPQSAVFLSKGKSYVYTVKGDEAKKLEISVGIETEGLVEVTSGIGPDDKVVLRGHNHLYEGCSVQVAP